MKNKVLGVLVLPCAAKSSDGKLVATRKSTADVKRRSAVDKDQVVRAVMQQ